jgi:hypothetical protein
MTRTDPSATAERLIAEREVQLDSAELGSIRLFAPRVVDNVWRCRYEISWPGFSRQADIAGEDSWQALQLAVELIPVEISVSETFKDGRLHVFGEPLTSIEDLLQWLAIKPMEVLNS